MMCLCRYRRWVIYLLYSTCKTFVHSVKRLWTLFTRKHFNCALYEQTKTEFREIFHLWKKFRSQSSRFACLRSQWLRGHRILALSNYSNYFQILNLQLIVFIFALNECPSKCFSPPDPSLKIKTYWRCLGIVKGLADIVSAQSTTTRSQSTRTSCPP